MPGRMGKALLLLVSLLLAAGVARAGLAPHLEGGEVVFSLRAPEAKAVALAGEFNGWDPALHPMERGSGGVWTVRVALPPGTYQYRFVVDGKWMADPENPATVKNNYNEDNSLFTLTPDGRLELRGRRPGEKGEGAGRKAGEGRVLLALIWHQHQPYYYDAARDQLIAPWVRTHTTKDYYDMTSLLADHPEVHVTVNLTPVLLRQIELYVDRLGPYFDERENRIRTSDFMKKWRGHTDPWADLMLTPVERFGPAEDSLLFRGEWSCFSISSVIMDRFPQYAALRSVDPERFTARDKLTLKCFFYLANFDPAFLRGPVRLVTGRTVDLSDLLVEEEGPIWKLRRPLTEEDANRLVAESYKLFEAVIPLHRAMRYDPAARTGQVEVTTTPYFHPILPLLIDAHAGRSGVDEAPADLSFAHPEDARWQVEEAARAYERWFGAPPDGMWPAEGSVSQAAAGLFAGAGVKWIATGDGVLARSEPGGMKATTAFRVVAGEGGDTVALFFRDTALSDLVGFRYQQFEPAEAVEDLVSRILRLAPEKKGEERLVTILLDGENAWEWYTRDPDAKRFLDGLYSRLAELQREGRLLTVTPAEYLAGNPDRGVEPHPVQELPEIRRLWPGSWIHADFSTWIGEEEENRAWHWLARVRGDLQGTTGTYQPLGKDPTSREQRVHDAWMALYAAEGSDWFWWYGDDQNTGEGDSRWDALYRAHLRRVYAGLRAAGYAVEEPVIPSLMQPAAESPEGQGAMAPGE